MFEMRRRNGNLSSLREIGEIKIDASDTELVQLLSVKQKNTETTEAKDNINPNRNSERVCWERQKGYDEE